MANRTFQVRIGDVISVEASVPSGVSMGSVIELLLFLNMENDLPDWFLLFCRLLADDTNMGGKSADLDLI